MNINYLQQSRQYIKIIIIQCSTGNSEVKAVKLSLLTICSSSQRVLSIFLFKVTTLSNFIVEQEVP